MSARKRIALRTPRAKRSRTGWSSRRQVANQKKKVSTSYQPLVVKRFPFPLRMQNTLRYVQEVQVSLNAAGYGNYLFRCNGMYDPNYTEAGHQPLYFDRLASIYNHFHVIASNIKVTPVRSGSTNAVELCVYIDDDTATNVTDFHTSVERPGARIVYSHPTQGLQPTVRSFWNAQVAFGGDIFDNDQLKGNNGGDPAEQQFYVINVQGGAADAVNVMVEIEYTAVWSELRSEGSS